LSSCSLHAFVLKSGITVFHRVLPIKFAQIAPVATVVFNTHSLAIFRIHFPRDLTDHRIPSVNTFQNLVPKDCHFVNTPDRDFFISFGIHSIDSTTHLVLCVIVDILSVAILHIFIGIFTKLFFTFPIHLTNFDFGASFDSNTP
jgi:hypothetical protein